jgi:hypothetical protein
MIPKCNSFQLANGLLFQLNDNYVSNVGNTIGRSILIGLISSAITLPANFFIGYLYRLCQYPFGTSDYKSSFFMTQRELHAASLKTGDSNQKNLKESDLGEGSMGVDMGGPSSGITASDPGLYGGKGPLDQIVQMANMPFWWLWMCHGTAAGVMFICSWFVVSYKADFVSKGVESVRLFPSYSLLSSTFCPSMPY